jgi:hypothetical protein
LKNFGPLKFELRSAISETVIAVILVVLIAHKVLLTLLIDGVTYIVLDLTF